MYKKILGIIIIVFSFNTHAIEMPTQSSSPLPSLQTTQNVDTVLSEQVQAEIRNTPELKRQSVSAASHDQVITLEGTVDNEAQEQAAINAAKSVKGVKEVKSQLTIKFTPTKDKI